MSSRPSSRLQSFAWLKYRPSRQDRQQKTRHLLLETLEDRRVLAALWAPMVNYPLPGAFSQNEASGLVRLDSNTNAGVQSSMIAGTAVDAVSGVPLVQSTDLSSSGFGYTLAHSREFTGVNNTGTNGNGWIVGNQPYLVVYSGGATPVVAYIESGKAPLLFTITGGGNEPGTWDSHLHAAAKLRLNVGLPEDPGDEEWILFDAEGNRLTFHDLPRSTPASGEFLGELLVNPNTGFANQTLFGKIKSRKTPGGTATGYVYHTAVGADQHLLNYIERVHNIPNSPNSIVERLQYAYQTVSNELGGSARLISSVTLQRGSEVRSMTYDYYTGEGSDAAHGRLGDLKLATLRQGGITGSIIRQEYYRYYKQAGYQPGDNPGPTNNKTTTGGTDPSYSEQTNDNAVWSGLKLAVSGPAFARMAANFPNYTAASDADLLPYADHFYRYQRWSDADWSNRTYDNANFTSEYNFYTRHRVVEALSAKTGKSSWSSGHGLTGFEIHVNQSPTGMGTDQFDPNIWRTRSTVYLPNSTNADSNADGRVDADQWADNDRYLIYANEMGQVLLSALVQVESTVRSVSAVSRSTSVVTVTANSHGLSTGDRVAINGTRSLVSWHSGQPALPSYDGVFEVTVTGANTFEYHISVPSNGSVPPADPGSMKWSKVTTWTADYARYRQKTGSDPNQYVGSDYEGYGQLVLRAHPSSVSGWREDYAALVGTSLVDVGSFQYIKDHSGLIDLYSYYSTTTATKTIIGGVAGYLWKTSVKQGEKHGNANPVPTLLEGGSVVESRQYIESNIGNQQQNNPVLPIFPVAKHTKYRETDEGGPQTTSYTYQWHVGTTQPSQIATEQPLIGLAQNGPYDPLLNNGPGDTTTVVYDKFGWPAWTKDGDGFINQLVYDIGTGAMVGTVVDVFIDPNGPLGGGGGGETDRPDWQMVEGGGSHLVTTGEVDNLGRPIRVTDPSQRVTRTIYNDLTREVRTYPGWSSTAGTILGPITIQREYWPISNAPSGERDVYYEVLTAAKEPGRTGEPGAYELTGTEVITTSDLRSLSRQITNNAGQVVSNLQYFSFDGMTYSQPVATLGIASNDSATGNYHVATTEYDDRGRVARALDPTGTITRNLYEGRGLLTQVWVGTDDIPTSGSWSPSNNTNANMTLVIANQYDNGLPGGDGNLTQVTRYPGAGAAERVSQMHYDWRDRLVATKAAVGTSESTSNNSHPITYHTYDNLNRQLSTTLYDGDTISIVDSNSDGVPDAPSDSLRRAVATSEYDDQSRMFRSTTKIVNQTNGGVASAGLVTAYWFDRRGNVVKAQKPDAPFEKTVTDGAGRVKKTYLTDAGSDSTWTHAKDVLGDKVLQQTELTYDNSGNLTVSRVQHRFHDASGTGELNGQFTPSRSQFVNMFYDAVNRLIATVNSGTVDIDRTSIPTSSDTILVTSQAYDDAGRLHIVTDPRGIGARTLYDAMGRTTKTIENYQNGQPSASDDATVQFSYNGLGQQLSVTVLLPASAVQETRYVYGANPTRGDALHDNRSLIATWHPSKTTGLATSSEADSYKVNALGERISLTDRNGTTRLLSYDLLGRMVGDNVSEINPSFNVNGSVRHVGYAFNTQGLLSTITSYSNTQGTTIVNQVLREYNDLGQLSKEYQSHAGEVNTSTTPKVEYSYSMVSGGANHSRLTQIVYPDGRQVNYIYDFGIDDTVSRVSSVTDALDTLESFSYLGHSTVVRRSRPEPGIELTLVKQSGENNGDGGDQYAGLDRFGRIANQRWLDTSGPGSGQNVDRYRYTHDRSSNRLSRENLVDTALNEFYTYDDLNRLTSSERGSMDARIVGSYIYHKGSSFDATSVQAALDTGKTLAREQTGTVTLTYNNLINTTLGLNGLVFDVENLASTNLSSDDFVFQMSPQGVYNQQNNPPAGWAAAPAPSQIQVIAASGGNPARIILRWNDNDIKNRWLRVTLKSTTDTGLFNDEVFYAGHLLGEVTGASSGIYTVANADRSPIVAAVGQTALVTSILDLNKDGVVSFADVSAVTPNIGVQQENIATAVNPLADLTRSQSWSLNALGNFQSLTNNDGSPQLRTHNLQNQVTAVGGANVSFDPNGNMTVDEKGRTLVWDAWNRLVRMQNGAQTLVEYQYDALKRRIVEQPSGQSARVFYYSKDWQVLEERVGGVAKSQNVWSPVYVDSMILRDRDADGNTANGFQSKGLEERIYVLHDANFNVTALVNTSGNVIERYYYEAYGRPVYLDANFDLLPSAQSQHAWQHLHQGGRLDAITGNYHFRNRDLSHSLGRWISQDPIGFEAGDANLYRYVGNGPTGLLDPIGLEGYWEGVLDVYQGYGNALVGTVRGLIHMANPINSAVVWWNVLNQPIDTFNAVWDDIEEKSGTLEGQGELVGDVLIGFATGGGLKIAGKAGRVAKLMDDLPEPRKPPLQQQCAQQQQGNGSYINQHQSGNVYCGKGGPDRMEISAERIAKEYNDPVVSKTHKPAPDTEQSFIDEQRAIEAAGGPGGNTYNKINSPGKKLIEGKK